METTNELQGLTVPELRRKYISKRFCIYRGKERGVIGVCRWIEPRSITALGKTHTTNWFRIEVEVSDGYHYPMHKSYWAMEDEIIRIQDEPDEVPFFSGW